MKKSLLEVEAKQEMLKRIESVKPGTEKLWGLMNVNQGLNHMYMAFQISYGEIKPATKGNWITRQMMRYFVLKTDMPTPKGKARTFDEINTVERGINPTDFDFEKRRLIETVQSFPNKPLAERSPLLGKMSEWDWARLNYTHLDHHLKQFGA